MCKTFHPFVHFLTTNLTSKKHFFSYMTITVGIWTPERLDIDILYLKNEKHVKKATYDALVET